MDFSFWAGIVLGGLVGLPVTIVGNLYSDQVRDYLDQRKVLRLNKQRSKELAIHERIRNLVSGDPRETLTFAHQRTLIVMMLLMTFACYGLASFSVLSTSLPVELRMPNSVIFPTALFFRGCALFGVVLTLLGFIDIRNTMSKVRRFEEYENQIREKWGDDAI